MNEDELKDLRTAADLLENPSSGARIANFIGIPIEKAIALLPEKATSMIGSISQKAIHGALKLSLKTLKHHEPMSGRKPPESSNYWHIAATAMTGAIGGAFGPFALAIEIPLSTTIMMRSIADVARGEGADTQDIQTQMECVQVLAFGGLSGSNDASEVGYFAAREALAKTVSNATAYIAKNGLEKEGAPVLVRLINKIAERYSVTVTEQVAAQSVPIIGAVGGAAINTIFIDHFQSMARGHFIVRRLEKEYNPELVRQKYLEIKQSKRQ